MWQIYKHTGNENDYNVYKYALNSATNEVRKSKRKFEYQLAQNTKSKSNISYEYLRSKQHVRAMAGPLEDNAVQFCVLERRYQCIAYTSNKVFWT